MSSERLAAAALRGYFGTNGFENMDAGARALAVAAVRKQAVQLADLRTEIQAELATHEENLTRGMRSTGALNRIAQLTRWLENLP